jgi:hypothetical protein
MTDGDYLQRGLQSIVILHVRVMKYCKHFHEGGQCQEAGYG